MSIAERMWRWVAAWPERTAEVGLDAVRKGRMAMAVRPLGSAEEARRFVDGSVDVRWPFAVVARVDGKETAGRLAALDALERLAAWMERGPLPSLGEGLKAVRLLRVGQPALAAAYADGMDDYQAAFVMEIHASGRVGLLAEDAAGGMVEEEKG